jgi:hypothetical protein
MTRSHLYLIGKRAGLFRTFCAADIVRHLGGDETLVGEIQKNAEVQAALPPDHPFIGDEGDGGCWMVDGVMADVWLDGGSEDW